MKIEELWIYPVKSCAGIRFQELEVLIDGPRFDRQWMIVDENGKFLTQRQKPEMALIKTSLVGDRHELKLDFAQQSFVLPSDGGTESHVENVVVWDSQVRASFEPSHLIHQALSDFLGLNVKIVFFGAQARRSVQFNKRESEFKVRFADGNPWLLVSQESVDDLNRRLSTPITFRRFRPNIVVSGLAPYSEDGFQSLKIGEIDFQVTRLCSRCVIINIDQDSGVKNNMNVTQTLAGYRKEGSRINFGVNLVNRNTGWLSVGDMLRR